MNLSNEGVWTFDHFLISLYLSAFASLKSSSISPIRLYARMDLARFLSGTAQHRERTTSSGFPFLISYLLIIRLCLAPSADASFAAMAARTPFVPEPPSDQRVRTSPSEYPVFYSLPLSVISQATGQGTGFFTILNFWL